MSALTRPPHRETASGRRDSGVSPRSRRADAVSRRPRRGARLWATVGAGALAVGLVLPASLAARAGEPDGAPASAALTNLAHLDFLLDDVTPAADVPGHSTYRQGEEPTLTAPWTYADAGPDGAFERVGGGPLDPATGHYAQGAFNADDIARAAVVYVRHWTQTGSTDSRATAYELLRSVAYLQTTDGPDAGNVVLWMQPDGTLNPSADPPELPDPSDSGASYWLARAIWALGEGAAAFAADAPAFAAFLGERLDLAVSALDRGPLSRYGQWQEADGARTPAWLIVDGADASAEAVLGLAAHVRARPDDAAASTALRELAEGIAAMSAGDARSWPYGAILPWAVSPTTWHAWSSQMPAALAAASVVLGDPSLLEPARADAAVFAPTLLTAGGPDNGWSPTPSDRVQIAYGADSRVQSLLAVADATGSDGFADLAAMQAAWFFGANRAGAAMYDPATGVASDGLQADGTVNRNSGAESTIHGLLTMLALDARPELASRARDAARVTARDGLELVEAEAATDTDGAVTTPEAWTGESSWSGSALTLARGGHAVFDLGTDASRRWIEPVVWADPGASSTSTWRAGPFPAGALADTGPARGASPAPGVLRPRSLDLPVPGEQRSLRVDVRDGTLVLDALLVRPVVSRLELSGAGGGTQLVQSSAAVPQPARVGVAGATGHVAVYDDRGALVRERSIRGEQPVLLPPGGFAVVQLSAPAG